MSKIATLRSCSIDELPRAMEPSSRLMAISRALELGSTGGSNVRGRLSGTVRAAAPAASPPRRVLGVLRLGFGLPDRAEIAQLGLNAFDVEADGAAVGELQDHLARRQVAGFEADRQQRCHRRLVIEVD